MSSENTKSIKALGGWEPTGELTSGPVAGPSQSPAPFQLQPLGPKQLRAPKLLLNQGPQSLATPLAMNQRFLENYLESKY